MWETQISHDILRFYPRDTFKSIRLEQVGMFLQGYTLHCADTQNRRLVVFFFRIFFLTRLEIGNESFGVVLWQSHMGESIAPFSVFLIGSSTLWLTQDFFISRRKLKIEQHWVTSERQLYSLCQDSQMNSVTVWILCADGKLSVKASYSLTTTSCSPPVLIIHQPQKGLQSIEPPAFSLPTSCVPFFYLRFCSPLLQPCSCPFLPLLYSPEKFQPD